MCGRYTLLASENEVKEAFHIDQGIDSYEPSYNIAPGQNVLAIIHDGKRKRAGYLKWGLVPFWAKDKNIGYKMINARSETAHEKPSFKQLMARKRCIIIADSFYEWRKEDKKKQPERIELNGRSLFGFAGLWDKWEQDGEVLFTCTMLTTEANEFMQKIHHRMPIILPKDQEDEWIKPEVMSPKVAQQYLRSLQSETLTSYQVDSYVNKPVNNDENCVTPI